LKRYGRDVGSLNIYRDDEKTVEKISSINGPQGFQWFNLKIDISSDSPYRVVLEGVIGNGNLGDIAIDDISYIENSPCNPITSVPIITYPTSYLDCDFECNCPCSWSFDPTSNMNWIISKGASEDLFTGKKKIIVLIVNHNRCVLLIRAKFRSYSSKFCWLLCLHIN
jgi:hypothetical protein